MSSEGLLIVVAAPSGAGKTSLVNALVERDPRLVISVSYTTRAPRPGEVDGRHYHFTDPAAFQRMREAGAFLECAEVFGHWYGTHEATTREVLAGGRDVILEIDWQGARQVRERFPACRSVFILPPSLETLRARLGRRAQDSEAVIAARMAEARAEISHCREFDHAIVNDDFDDALDQLATVIDAWRSGAPVTPEEHGDLLAEMLGNS
ncbi:MAG: guanylate kinase [Gammaproteobacteria bacterium]